MLWAVVIAFLVGLDQLTKHYIRVNIPLGQSNELVGDFFYFTHVENTGAAFGMLKNGRYFFIILTLVMLTVMVYFLVKKNQKWLRLSITFIIGGAVGNLIDRVLFGQVTDFFDFYIFQYNYPVFNIADVCVNIGSILLFFYLIFIYKEPEKAETET